MFVAVILQLVSLQFFVTAWMIFLKIWFITRGSAAEELCKDVSKISNYTTIGMHFLIYSLHFFQN